MPTAFDYRAGLFSLPLAFGTQKSTIPADIPYLVAEPERVRSWRERIGGQGFKVGICWQGKFRPSMGLRSFPRGCFDAFCGLERLRLISLQKDCQSLEPRSPGGVCVEMLGAEFDGGPDAFIDAAAVMENLDLIITPDTAIAHLAGALGRPVWITLKHVPDWRWCPEGATTAWYPTARLFRQATPGDWSGVFEEMRGELARLVRGSGLTEVPAATQ